MKKKLKIKFSETIIIILCFIISKFKVEQKTFDVFQKSRKLPSRPDGARVAPRLTGPRMQQGEFQTRKLYFEIVIRFPHKVIRMNCSYPWQRMLLLENIQVRFYC